MQRSSSANRVSDESAAAVATTTDQLPKYNPQSHAANKERNRHKSAETAVVHLIPLLLLLCVFILWFFSTPAVDLVDKDDDPFIARIEGLTVDGDIDDNAASSWLPDLELRDSKSAKHLANPDPLE